MADMPLYSFMRLFWALKQVPNGMGKGIFYWEPEVGAELLPDRYPLGAALKVGENTLEFTSALAAYRDCK